MLEGLPSPTVLEEPLRELGPGQRTSLVAKVEIWRQGSHLCRSLVGRQPFLLKADLSEGVHTVSILGAVVTKTHLGFCLAVEEPSYIFEIPMISSKSFQMAIETCSGIGGISCGAKAAGFRTVVSNEIRSSFANILEQDGQQVVNDDIGYLRTVKAIWESIGEPAIVAMGFNCQPFSKAGDKRAGMDPRSQTLPFGLFLAWMVQAPAIILECVLEAATDSWVKAQLKTFQEMSKYEYSEVALDLNAIWPARRRRWWAILVHPTAGKVPLSPMPALPFAPSIADLLPDFMNLPEDERHQLLLQKPELLMFKQYSRDIRQHLLDSTKPLPTSLHSWGNQCGPCACGCRDKAFSHLRLEKRGLVAALVEMPDQAPPNEQFRHISPREAALLNGWPRKEGWNHQQRCILAGIGQLASPLQAAWIFAQFRQHLEHAGYDFGHKILPKQILGKLCCELWDLRDQWFHGKPSVAMMVFEEKVTELLNIPKRDSWKCDMDNCPICIIVEDSCPMEIAEPEVIEASTKEFQEISPTIPFSVDEHLKVMAQSQVPFASEESCFQATGAIAGFACPQEKQCKRAFVCAQQTPAPTERNTEMDVVLGISTPRLVLPSIRVDTAPFIQSSVMLVDLVNGSIQGLHFSPGQTLGDLLQAEEVLNPPSAKMHKTDGVGGAINLAASLHASQVIVFNDEKGMLAHTNPTIIERQLQTCPRAIGLFSQGAFVAVDEFSFYLHSTASALKSAWVIPTNFFDVESAPLVAANWFSQICWALESNQAVISAMLLDHHWHPIRVVKGEKCLQVYLTPEGKKLWPVLFTPEVRVKHEIITVELQKGFENDCGFQSVNWLIAIASKEPFELVSTYKASAMRFQFALTLFNREANKVWPHMLSIGGGSDFQQEIAKLLQERGVFEDRLLNRTKALIDAVGESKLRQALQSPRPWAMIKQHANSCQPKMQLIAQDEFEKIRQARAATGKQVGNKKQKMRNDRALAQPELDICPSDLFIPEGVFKTVDGKSISQIPLREVSATATGVVPGTELELMPFLSKGQISQHGLALIIVDPTPDKVAKYGDVQRFPVSCTSTQEPLIISAIVVQKGGVQVVRNRPDAPPKVYEADNAVFKMMLYQDQVAEWHGVCKAPVRAILERLPFLQTCLHEGCTCPKRHAGPDAQDLVIDVWGRDWVSYRFDKAAPEKADVFVCQIRILQPGVTTVIRASGTAGLYCEQRGIDGKRDDASFHTVWLQKRSLDDALADQALVEEPTALVRIGHRYGLQAKLQHAEKVHICVRGSAPFLAGPDKMVWEISPLPWGTTKKSVQELISQWGWQARPMQPVGRSSDSTGIVWQVLALEHPGHTVFSLQHGDVLLTQVKQKGSSGKVMQLPKIEAGRKTKAFLSAQQAPKSSSTDPWQQQADPWAKYHAQQNQNANQWVTHQHLQSLEAAFDAKLAQKVPEAADVSMDNAVADRVSALESQMMQVMAQQQAQNAQSASMANQIGMLTQKFDEQTKSLEHSLENAIDTKLNAHMSRLESLLSKRARE